ncbi:MAG: hypothetical protein COY58_06090 [Gammaproteobacteria bacterium CG_4_10_14_0_8_um_filter_38_16]|nr:MAG: hypothetical protein COY58_06090 [Gammaproteobacteria bacterium CG_4_10_14_0_8_um_filter_38_16]PJA03631.1 MAG: hypothetical protein COX72_04325 [Gammaproteobacteria bacterium CG_4_10_14_0_2_um_filter_38_22]PJB10423.1 MAG: hypothetical protein CO120_04855 [Gammaproteobacteria bacterium CG_4_9_14_3_um_filter_38_9]
MLATAINDAITNYKKSLDDLRNAAGRQQEMANETLIGDCETVVNNLVVAIWSLAVDQTVSDRSAQLPMITKDNAKVFFMKLGDDQDQDAGWKVENHLARNAFFNAGRMSLKTTIVVHVLDVIDKGLTEEIKKNPQNPFLEKVSATFFELSNVPKCESGWARNVFFEIRASIYRSENPVSAYYFSE